MIFTVDSRLLVEWGGGGGGGEMGKGIFVTP